MNRIEILFKEKQKNILSIYFTAGYPKLNDTVLIIRALQQAGADMIEIGMPFSDPLADGPIIQHSSHIALQNGMSMKILFDQLANIRTEIKIPLLLMGYLNPVLHFGVEKFCSTCKDVGIDGIILPDLPLLEYQKDYKSIVEKNGLVNIFLITPQTSEDRIRQIDDASKGFIYMVSTSSTTGAKKDFMAQQENYFKRISSLNLKHPLLTGFGISDHSSFLSANKYSSGGIIGSAFIQDIQQTDELQTAVTEFVRKIKNPK